MEGLQLGSLGVNVLELLNHTKPTGPYYYYYYYCNIAIISTMLPYAADDPQQPRIGSTNTVHMQYKHSRTVYNSHRHAVLIQGQTLEGKRNKKNP